MASPSWYHSLELAPGEVTPGWFDLREVPSKLPLPGSLAGKRCLDVGTFDGFWAFEMERRGGEVHAVDVIDPYAWDWPAGRDESVVAALADRKHGGDGFETAREALGSRVTREERSVYDLSPDTVGTFDFVYVGSLLLHLRDPVRALAAAASVCRGELLLLDAIDPLLTRLFRRLPVASLDGLERPWWWWPNLAALQRMTRAAGLEPVRPPVRVRMPPGRGQPRPPLRKMLPSRAGRRAYFSATVGDPHAALLLRPRA